MFDIFTTHPDGTAQLILSVSCLAQARQVACELTQLTAGGCFGYFEHIESDNHVEKWERWEIDLLNN